MRIQETDFGVACRIGNTIYINKETRKYPRLYSALIEHEKEHSNNFNTKDLAIDLTGEHLKHVKKEYWLFVISHPNAWSHFMPIWIYDKKFVFDITMSIMWLFLLFLLIILGVVIL